MRVNEGALTIGCYNCKYLETDENFGHICQHKASMEGVEAEREFYRVNEVTECDFHEFDEYSS